jgi:hypothetical protein
VIKMNKLTRPIPRNYCTTDGPLGAEIQRRRTELLLMRVKRALDRARGQPADQDFVSTVINEQAAQ